MIRVVILFVVVSWFVGCCGTDDNHTETGEAAVVITSPYNGELVSLRGTYIGGATYAGIDSVYSTQVVSTLPHSIHAARLWIKRPIGDGSTPTRAQEEWTYPSTDEFRIVLAGQHNGTANLNSVFRDTTDVLIYVEAVTTDSSVWLSRAINFKIIVIF